MVGIRFGPRSRRFHARILAPAAIALGGLAIVGPGTASAATFRYAEPGGNGAEPCEFTDPCSIESAVAASIAGDSVYLTTGTYSLSNKLTVPAGVTVAGIIAGHPESVVLDTGFLSFGVEVNGAQAALSDLTILHSGIQVALGVYNGAVVSRVISRSAGSFACDVNASLIRDSYCLTTLGNGAALSNAKGGGTGTATAINVTAVSTGASSTAIWVAASSTSATMEAYNVIAMSSGLRDEGASADTGFTATIIMQNSNFDTKLAGGTGTVVLTDPGSGTNQTDPPLLVDPGNGDPRPLPDSPTIDAGATFASMGSFDLLLRDRTIGEAPDIGAVEFDPLPTAKITKKPRKRTTARTARFKFKSDEDGTFACKLDGKPFKACESPKTYRHLKPGRHKFAVKAIDFAEQPSDVAKYSWRVLK